MSVASYVALFSLTVMVLMYAFEQRSPLALLGFSLASTIAALSQFVLGRWPFGLAAMGFAVIALGRWRVRQRRNVQI
jgi:hypothetical protein